MNWLCLSAMLNLLALGFIIFLIFIPPPKIIDLGLECENGKTCYERYAENCEVAERLRAVAIHSLDNASSAKDRASAQQNKTDAEDQIVRECDLAAQYLAAESAASMDFGAYLMTGLTFLGVVLVGGTLYYTKKTLNEARGATIAANRTAYITRSIGNTQVRAYLGITDFFFTCDKHGQNIYISTKNFGMSPCVNLEATFSVFLDNFNVTGAGNPFFDSFGDVAPGGKGFVRFRLSEMEPSKFLSNLAGKTVRVVGRFSYFDVFGNEQKVPFNYEGVITGAKTDLGIQGRKPDRHYTEPRT